jgi:hypothetical protein
MATAAAANREHSLKGFGPTHAGLLASSSTVQVSHIMPTLCALVYFGLLLHVLSRQGVNPPPLRCGLCEQGIDLQLHPRLVLQKGADGPCYPSHVKRVVWSVTSGLTCNYISCSTIKGSHTDQPEIHDHE